MANNHVEKIPILKERDSNAEKPLVPIRYIITFLVCMAFAITCGIRMNVSIAIIPMANDFDWSKQRQQTVLSAFYYLLPVSSILGGVLCEKFGASTVLQISMFLSSLMMLLTDIAAATDFFLFVLTRVLDGIGQGFMFPICCKIVAKWCKSNERSTLISIACSGMSLGPVAVSQVSTLLCSGDFLGGWPSTFYLLGISGVTWSLFWFIIGSSEAEDNRWISKAELNSILISRKDVYCSKIVGPIPWRTLLTSVPVWALVVALTGHDWGFFLLFSNIPIFYKSVLGFEFKKAGILSIMPHALIVCTTIAGGLFADYLISREILNVGKTRKLVASFDLVFSSVFLILIGYVENAAVSVVLITLSFGMYGFAISSLNVNSVDLAPNYSGFVMGFVLSISTCSGFIAPSILAVMIKTYNTIIQWRKTFCLCGGVQCFAFVIFLVFGSGEVQEDVLKIDNNPNGSASLLQNSKSTQDE